MASKRSHKRQGRLAAKQREYILLGSRIPPRTEEEMFFHAATGVFIPLPVDKDESKTFWTSVKRKDSNKWWISFHSVRKSFLYLYRDISWERENFVAFVSWIISTIEWNLYFLIMNLEDDILYSYHVAR